MTPPPARPKIYHITYVDNLDREADLRDVFRWAEVARRRWAFSLRVRQQPVPDEDERAERLRSVQNRVVDLLDSWKKIVEDYQLAGVQVQYQKY